MNIKFYSHQLMHFFIQLCISLLSYIIVLEKVMYKQLQDHLNKHSILAQEQFGFRSDSTTNEAIYKLINETLL